MDNEYVYLFTNNENQQLKPQRRSLWRHWKMLSRFQRNLATVVFVAIIVTVVYYWAVREHGNREQLLADLQPQHQEKLKEEEEKKIIQDESEVIVKQSMQEQLEKQRDLDNKIKLENKLREEDRKKALNKEVTNKKSKEYDKVDEIKKQVHNYKQTQENNKITSNDNVESPTPKRVKFAPPGNDRQAAVVGMVQHAWTGYTKYAWGHDHLRPISQTYHDWFGLGLTIVDGLDTLWLLGLYDEFNASREWVDKRFSVSLNEFHDVNLFEVTIRVLGGLLSAYHLSGDPVFLNRSLSLGERLMPCFTKSPSAIPYSDVNLASHLAHSPKWIPDSSTSEVTTLQLEFRTLSRSCHDAQFEDAAFLVTQHVHNLEKTDGLVPIFINPNTGRFRENTEIKLGARGDSYYEYLLKQWIQTGKVNDFLKEDYLTAVQGIIKRLVKHTPQKNLTFIGELKANTREFVPKMDHLVCFVPGMLALGVHHGMPRHHMTLAEELMNTCYQTYSERPTFLAPEITFFKYIKGNIEDTGRPDMFVKSNDAHNLLRPEFIESLWYMWVVTGNMTYQEWGWHIFQAFEKYTKVKNGYTSIGNVNNPLDTRPRDMMESFFISETIKYFYLLFSDNRHLIDIDRWVMNTEGHPLPIYSS